MIEAAKSGARRQNGYRVFEPRGRLVEKEELGIERERAALQVLAESTPGVKAVHDKLVWVEPLSVFVIPPVGSEPAGGA